MLARTNLVLLLLSLPFLEGFNPNWNNDWIRYKVRYRKYYDKADDPIRRTVWENNKKFINKHNEEYKEGKHLYEMEENFLTDQDHNERQYLGKGVLLTEAVVIEMEASSPVILSKTPLVQNLDLRTSSCTTRIKDQLKCGCCWSFSAVHPVEYQNCIKYKRLLELSEQQLVDCSNSTGNYGCNGGWYTNGWDYIVKRNGINPGFVYPYKGTQNSYCLYNPGFIGARVQSWKYVPSLNTTQMMAALNTYGPLAVAIEATSSFDFYKDGIFTGTDCSPENVNHAVNIVGYGSTDSGVDYWIVRNSWGTAWGLKGYMLIERGKNVCSIERYPAYPIVN